MTKANALSLEARQFIEAIDTAFQNNRSDITRYSDEQELSVSGSNFPFDRGARVLNPTLTRPKPKYADRWQGDGGFLGEQFDDGHQLDVLILPDYNRSTIRGGRDRIMETYGIRGGLLVRDSITYKYPIGTRFNASGGPGGAEEIPDRQTERIRGRKVARLLRWVSKAHPLD